MPFNSWRAYVNILLGSKNYLNRALHLLVLLLNLQVFGTSTMRPLASLIVALLCMFASKVATETFGEMIHVVDYRTLKTCYSKKVSGLAPA